MPVVVSKVCWWQAQLQIGLRAQQFMVTTCQLAPLCRKGLQVRQLTQTHTRGHIGEVELTAQHVDFHAVVA